MDRSTYRESYRSAVTFGTDARKRGVAAATLSAGVMLCLCIAPLSMQNAGASDKETAPPKLSEIKPVEAKQNGSKLVAPDAAPATATQKKPASHSAAAKASLPTPSTPGHAFDNAAGKVTGIAVVSDTTPVASLLLEQLQSGQMSAATAWKSGQLNGKLALELLAHQELFRVKWRALVNELAALVATNAPELIVDVEQMHPQAKAHLAAYFGSVGDPRAVAFYESMLAAIQNPPIAVPAMPVFKLSDYYAKIGDFRKAAETRLRMKEYTTSAASLGNSEVEAARFYMQIGEEEKAKRLYEGASRHGYGWATGLAMIDQGRALINQGKHEEARKLLSTPVTGQYAEQISIGLLAFLGKSYYMTGEFESAKKYSRQAIAQGEALELLKNEGLEETVNLAHDTLKWSQLWLDKPLHYFPSEIKWILRKADHAQVEVAPRRLLRAEIKIRAFKAVPLEVSCDDSQVRWQLYSQQDDPWKLKGDPLERFVEWTLEVSIPSTVERSSVLQIHSPELQQSIYEVQLNVKREQ